MNLNFSFSINMVYYILCILSGIASLVGFFKGNNVMGVIFITATVWILPVTQNILQQMKIYVPNNIIVLIFILLIGIGIASSFIEKPKQIVHEHTISDWIFDTQSGYFYKECKECGVLIDKKIEKNKKNRKNVQK